VVQLVYFHQTFYTDFDINLLEFYILYMELFYIIKDAIVCVYGIRG